MEIPAEEGTQMNEEDKRKMFSDIRLRFLEEQIDRLAKFIMAEIPGEPSQNEGAVDTAIRIMRVANKRVAELEELETMFPETFREMRLAKFIEEQIDRAGLETNKKFREQK